MKKIRGAIFDLDGTLISFKIDYIKARQEVIDFLKKEAIPQNLLTDNLGIFKTFKIVEKYLKSIQMGLVKLPEIKSRINQIVSFYELEGAKNTNLMEGTLELLAFLKGQDYKIGLFTLENRRITNFILNRFSIGEFFNSVVTRDDVQNFKPDPEHLNKVLENLSLNPNEVIVVGDNPVDIQCAKHVGAIAIAIITERHTIDELENEGADILINSLGEVKNILNTDF